MPPGVPVWLRGAEGKGWGGSVLLLCPGLSTRHRGRNSAGSPWAGGCCCYAGRLQWQKLAATP